MNSVNTTIARVEVEVVAVDPAASDDFDITAISFDAFADVRKPGGKRWTYVEVARWHPGHEKPFTATKLAWHLATTIAKTLNKDPRFADLAREALCLAREGERDAALEFKAELRRDDLAAAE